MSYKDPKKQKRYQREWRRKQRLKVRLKIIKLFGGACINCKNDDFRVLQIDHINPILDSKNRTCLDSGVNLASRILSEKENKNDYQLLCANCHMIKSFEERKTYPNYRK